MDFYPIYSPSALLRVEHDDLVLCLALGKCKPFLCWSCCLCAGLPAAVMLQRGSGPSWVVPLWSGGDHVTLCWQEGQV